jgi:hypothetical protein
MWLAKYAEYDTQRENKRLESLLFDLRQELRIRDDTIAAMELQVRNLTAVIERDYARVQAEKAIAVRKTAKG